MTLYKSKYRIESARLPGWDYSSAGYYFITVCTYKRECLFGHVTDNKMFLNDFGRIVQNEWDKSFVIRRELLRGEFVVMPNHFHGIVQVVKTGDQIDTPVETSGRTSLPPEQQRPRIRPKSVSSFMGGVKSVITKQINEIRHTPGAHVLQYRFHDHIIRDANELSRIRQYIKNNPSNWKYDKLNFGTGNYVFEESVTYGEESWMI
jgi:REP element-mobilizing transposase RayT